uniref:Leucine rich repeat containing 75A n=1 Tax=Panthera tigris altaica TaxID=74533 RepID=A0A8C9KAY9_PANTA
GGWVEPRIWCFLQGHPGRDKTGEAEAGVKGRAEPLLTSGRPSLLQDLGMESTSLDDVLYRYASFRNLVDPITHDLIISLARYIHCPKPPQSCPGWEPSGQHGGPVGHPADLPGPGAGDQLPAALRGTGGQRGAGLHRPHGRHGPAAAAGAQRPAPPRHAGPQRQPADAGPAA